MRARQCENVVGCDKQHAWAIQTGLINAVLHRKQLQVQPGLCGSSVQWVHGQEWAWQWIQVWWSSWKHRDGCTERDCVHWSRQLPPSVASYSGVG